MAIRLLIFLAINFAALALGGIFTGKGVPSDWYQELAKAPWTPPGWMFGTAWTTIMICFSFFMAYAWNSVSNQKILITLFVIQWILNVGWSPVFFHYHFLTFGLITISALTLSIAWMTIYYFPQTKYLTLLLLPYLVWLMIATSLNGYILIKN